MGKWSKLQEEDKDMIVNGSGRQKQGIKAVIKDHPRIRLLCSICIKDVGSKIYCIAYVSSCAMSHLMGQEQHGLFCLSGMKPQLQPQQMRDHSDQ